MARRSIVAHTAVLALLAGLTLPAAPAAGGKPARPDRPDAPVTRMTPRHVAEDLYDRGLAARDKGLRHLRDAAEAEGRRRARSEKRARRQFEKAADHFREAVRHDPDMHQAYASLGFALRRLGEFEPSLRAYDRALQLSPDYVEAIEYRAEAYLGLGRLDDAREAYMDLFRRAPEHAALLLTAMRAWLDEQPDGGAAGPARRESFAEWVAERERLAGPLDDATGPDRDW